MDRVWLGCPNYNNLFCSYIAGVELQHFVKHAKFDKSLFVLTVAQTYSHQSVAFGVIQYYYRTQCTEGKKNCFPTEIAIGGKKKWPCQYDVCTLNSTQCKCNGQASIHIYNRFGRGRGRIHPWKGRKGKERQMNARSALKNFEDGYRPIEEKMHRERGGGRNERKKTRHQ